LESIVELDMNIINKEVLVKNTIIYLGLFILLTACSSEPAGKVVATTGVDTFQVEYPANDLQVGDRVRITETKLEMVGDGYVPSVKKVIGEGKVSALIQGHFYEVKTESAMHVPTDALIEKL
jgi:hypothetical protein